MILGKKRRIDTFPDFVQKLALGIVKIAIIKPIWTKYMFLYSKFDWNFISKVTEFFRKATLYFEGE